MGDKIRLMLNSYDIKDPEKLDREDFHKLMNKYRLSWGTPDIDDDFDTAKAIRLLRYILNEYVE